MAIWLLQVTLCGPLFVWPVRLMYQQIMRPAFVAEGDMVSCDTLRACLLLIYITQLPTLSPSVIKKGFLQRQCQVSVLNIIE